MPVETAAALKEWAVVNRALREGRQVFLLRKGGLVEKDQAFAPREKEFYIFPTFEHQNPIDLRPEFAEWPAAAERLRPPPGGVDIDVFARADETRTVTDAAALRRLLPRAVWSESFYEKRLAYKPENPLTLVFLRCFRAPQPHRVPDDPAYAGCTSWVTLREPLSSSAFYPVLSAEVFAEAKKDVLRAFDGA